MWCGWVMGFPEEGGSTSTLWLVGNLGGIGEDVSSIFRYVCYGPGLGLVLDLMLGLGLELAWA